METKFTRPFSGLKSENWRNLLYFGILCAYIILFFSFLQNGARGSDYELYWSTGKIADEKGYSQIYSLYEMRRVYQQYMAESGDYRTLATALSNKFPVPYLSFFLIPYQFLSRISMVRGFIVWTFFNLFLLIGYLYFFLRSTYTGTNNAPAKLLVPFLISYPIFFNIMCGQVGVFNLICIGEFVRQAINKKALISGLWLGGLLIKPPLLVLVIPILIIFRYWKALAGFIISSGTILFISFMLSGQSGMMELIDLWTKYGTAIPARDLLIMVNWRMVGVGINLGFNTSLGWIIASFGSIATILVVFYLSRQKPSYGSELWIIIMTGIFAATLAVSWYVLYHMMVVLVPFLIYALVHKLLPEKIVLAWSIFSSVVYLVVLLFGSFSMQVLKVLPKIDLQIILSLTGLILNLVILISVHKAVKVRNLTNNKIH